MPRTIEGYPYRQQRIRLGVYRVQIDDGGGFVTAGQVMRRATTPVSWGWSSGDATDWGKWGVEGTLNEAVASCALAWIRGVEAVQRPGGRSSRRTA